MEDDPRPLEPPVTTAILDQARPYLLALGLTLLSGVGDAYGFVHASRIWRLDTVRWDELGRSAIGFGFGMSMQWLAIRYLQQVGVTVAEVQTVVWFAVTMIGMALLSRSFLEWAAADRIVAAVVVCGLGWLVVRTG